MAKHTKKKTTKIALIATAWALLVMVASLVVPVGPAQALDGSLTLTSSTVVQGQDVVASYATSNPQAANWVGLYRDPGNGPVNQTYVGPSTKWSYTPSSSGTVQFSTGDLAPGSYVLYYLFNDGYTWVATPATFTITSDAAPQFVTGAFTLRNARVGQAYSQLVSGVTYPATGLTFTKTSGAAWAAVSASGTISGTPTAAEASSLVVTAADGQGRTTSATVTIPVKEATAPLVGQLKVMSFNTWHGGTQVNSGMVKQLKFLLDQNVDAVGLQETQGVNARDLANALGWSYVQSTGSMGVISRYPITAQYGPTYAGIGARIQLDATYPKSIVLWSAHLSYTPYGPYDACFSHMSVSKILQRENQSGRPADINGILNAAAGDLANAATTPVLVVGDFNAPSHKDWTAATASSHCGYGAIAWPTSKAVEQAGMTDSYRVAHPNPATNPGNTWSPLFPFHNGTSGAVEPQDRIDFIHFKGPLQVLASTELVEGSPQAYPGHAGNQWTSDHRAVVTTFQF